MAMFGFVVSTKITYQTAPAPWQTACDPRFGQTPHPGGMLVGIADGSVRALAPDIKWEVWDAACSPNGGEVLDADWSN
jgi:hypothetical protein